MKKCLSIILLGALILFISACGDSSDNQTSQSENEAESEEVSNNDKSKSDSSEEPDTDSDIEDSETSGSNEDDSASDTNSNDEDNDSESVSDKSDESTSSDDLNYDLGKAETIATDAVSASYEDDEDTFAKYLNKNIQEKLKHNDSWNEQVEGLDYTIVGEDALEKNPDSVVLNVKVDDDEEKGRDIRVKLKLDEKQELKIVNMAVDKELQ